MRVGIIVLLWDLTQEAENGWYLERNFSIERAVVAVFRPATAAIAFAGIELHAYLSSPDTVLSLTDIRRAKDAVSLIQSPAVAKRSPTFSFFFSREAGAVQGRTGEIFSNTLGKHVRFARSPSF